MVPSYHAIRVNDCIDRARNQRVVAFLPSIRKVFQRDRRLKDPKRVVSRIELVRGTTRLDDVDLDGLEENEWRNKEGANTHIDEEHGAAESQCSEESSSSSFSDSESSESELEESSNDFGKDNGT